VRGKDGEGDAEAIMEIYRNSFMSTWERTKKSRAWVAAALEQMRQLENNY
jgi:hypothetical protein